MSKRRRRRGGRRRVRSLLGSRISANERLDRLVKYLREKWHHCFWCKLRYPDELMEGCPGPWRGGSVKFPYIDITRLLAVGSGMEQ